jgi:hypothetical protein
VNDRVVDRQPNGLELSRRFFAQEVAPRLTDRWPDLAYSAALIGPGSEVLGFDDAVSRDHHWGPRVIVFLPAEILAHLGKEIHAHLAETLPYQFMGFSTNLAPPDPEDNGTQLLSTINKGPVNHRVELHELSSFLRNYIGIEDLSEIDEHDWLTFPEQKLRSLVAGEVFHDGMARPEPSGGDSPAGVAAGGRASAPRSGGLLEWMREKLAWYPRNAWLYQMAAAWARIGQDEHLMGRAGFVGDEVGSVLTGARLVRTIMRLCFLMERTYAPYAKWFGTAFRRLACGPSIYPMLHASLTAADWRTREVALVPAYEAIARMHNRLGITDPLPETVHQFHGRPFKVIADQGFAEAILSRIDSDFLTEVTRRSPIGGIDLWSDNTDMLEDPEFRPTLRRLYE